MRRTVFGYLFFNAQYLPLSGHYTARVGINSGDVSGKSLSLRERDPHIPIFSPTISEN
jgi:hypothetical protein